MKNLYLMSKIVNTQFLAPKVKRLFKSYIKPSSVFIYSFNVDPNICQLSLHGKWDELVFAWITHNAIFIFEIPKKELGNLGLSINHADGTMLDVNTLFKHSIRLKNRNMGNLSKYLIDILD